MLSRKDFHKAVAMAAMNYARKAILKSHTELAFTNESMDANFFKIRESVKPVRQIKKQLIDDRLTDFTRVDTEDIICVTDTVIEITKKYSLGNCNELEYVALDYIIRNARGVVAEAYTIEGDKSDHVFLVIGRTPGSNENDPLTWGDDAYICDPLAQLVYPASEFKNFLKTYRVYPELRQHKIERITDSHQLVPHPHENTFILGRRNSKAYLQDIYALYNLKLDSILSNLKILQQGLFSIRMQLKTYDPRYDILSKKLEDINTILIKMNQDKKDIEVILHKIINNMDKEFTDLSAEAVEDPYHQLKKVLVDNLSNLNKDLLSLKHFSDEQLDILNERQVKQKLMSLITSNNIIPSLNGVLNEFLDRMKNLHQSCMQAHQRKNLLIKAKNLQSIPEDLRDEDICMAAIVGDPAQFKFVPLAMLSFSFCKTAINKNPALIAQIKQHRTSMMLNRDEYRKLIYPEQHATKYFAMFNNAVAVADTKLEGGTNSESLAYYNYLLNLELPDCPLGLNITAQQADALQKGLTDLRAMQDLIEECHDRAILNTKQGLDTIINAIFENSKQSGVCYLPSGWSGTPSGHFAGLKLRRLENGLFAFSIINHGSGIAHHHKVSKNGSKDKYIYQSDEYEVDLQSDKGRELLQRLFELKYDEQRKNDVNEVVNQYSADDLYGLLKLYGKEMPLEDKLSEKAVTPQRGGTCNVTNLHAIARDILINNGADLKTRKRYHFVMKLRSMIAAFAVYQQDKNKCPYNVMEWALREFATRINKEFRNILSDDELIYCSQLQAKIQACLDHDKKASIENKCQPLALPAVEGAAPKYKETLLETRQKRIKKYTPANKELETSTALIIKPRPDEVVKLLQLERVGGKAQSLDFNKMYALFNSLPHCSGLAQDPFWDKVPTEDIGKIIQNLTHIVAELTSSSQSNSRLIRARTFAMALMAYDIAAQLAERSSTMIDNPFKLGNQYAFGFDDVYSEQSFFSDPIAYHTVKHIANNFAQRARGRRRVLTNAVNYDDNKYDNTVYYIIRVVLTDEQRSAVEESLRKEMSAKKITDEMLFEHLMKQENIKMKYRDDTEYVLDETIAALISLSGSAHRLGHFSQTYNTKEVKDRTLWFYNDNQFHHELERQAALEKSQLAKHLPKINESRQQGDYQDWSENALFHPEQNLTSLRDRFKEFSWDTGEHEYAREVQLQPYQLYPSGSFSPESTKWNPARDQQFIYEQLNEDFRHLECTPNLQIVRALAWAKSNLDKLRNSDVRNRIDELIFQYGKLDTAFANQLEPTLLNLELFLAALLNYCKNEASNDTNLLTWAAILAHDIRYHLEVAAKLYKLPINNTLPSFQELILERIKHTQDNNVRSTLASIVLADFRNTSPLTEDEYCLALVCRILAYMGDGAGISNEVWHKMNVEIRALVEKEGNQVTKKLNQLLSLYLNLPRDLQWRLVDSQLVADGSDLLIDLATGSLQKKGIQMKERTLKTIADNKELFTRLHLTEKEDFTLLYCDLSSLSEFSSTLQSGDGRWEFIYSASYIHSSSTFEFTILQTRQLVTIENTQMQFKLLNDTDLKNLFTANNNTKNPFESAMFYNTRYQYWQALDDNSLLFVRDEKNSEIAYCYSLKDGVISQLTANNAGEWQRNGKLLLNLTAGDAAIKAETNAKQEASTDKPKVVGATDLEKKWAKRLGPLFGVDNVRCIAVLSEDKTTCRVERIEHLSLGLNFTLNERQQLMCDDVPGYFLSEQQSIEALQGLPSIIILQNNNGDKKYYLPAFSLNSGENNNAFNQEEIVDAGNLCNKSQAYYPLTLNANQELVADSVDANLYLAILYRSMGDFKRAIQYLERCQSSTNITATTVAIALQVMKRKIKSPLGAAFDLKLECYLREHQQKWSKDSEQIFAPVEFPNDWHKWIKSQLRLYKNSFSNYKIGVAIIPSYCRLTDEEFKWLGQKSKQKNASSKSKAKKIFEGGERLKKARRLPELILKEIELDWRGQENSWRTHVESLGANIKSILAKNSGQPAMLTTWRSYSNESKTPGFDYLICNFSNLFDDALSQSPEQLKQLHKTLFALLHNDKNDSSELYELIALLAFTSKYPHYFANFKKPSHPLNLLIQIGEVFYQHRDALKSATAPLIAYEQTMNELTIEKPLPSDHVAEHVVFKLPAIECENECKYPLESIAKKYFTRGKDKPIAKRNFALKLSDLPNATPIEKRVFTDYEQGHQENQTKMKAVYTVVEEFNLSALQEDLEAIKKDDKKRIAHLERDLIMLANQTPLGYPSGAHQARAHNVLVARASEELNVITIGDLFTAFLKRDPTLLTKQNPFLTQQDISQLFAQLADYALLQSRIDQANEAMQIFAEKKVLADIEPYQQQLLAGVLNKTRAYEIAEYPEFLVYEYATKRLLREDQANTLKKIIQLIESEPDNAEAMRHCLLQFAAGGGKTAVLIPILAQRFAHTGFLPIIFNTTELYKTGLKDIPKHLRASFQQNMEVVDRELDFDWTEEKLQQLSSDLERWRKEKKCVLLKPVTWHSINIAMKSAYITGDEKRARAAKSVLDFFKTQCVKLEDECHLVSDPLQQSIKTAGVQKIPDQQLDLLLKFYDYLVGHAENSRHIAKLAGIKPKRTDPVSPKDLIELQKMLANVIANEGAFKDISREDLVAYLTQEESDKTRPKWLQNLYDRRVENPTWKEFIKGFDEKLIEEHPSVKTMPDAKARDMADLIILARSFINTHLPHILSMQDQKDYGSSIHGGDLTAAPKHEGKDVTSHYGDHTLVAALTIQMYHQRGLASAQLEQLFAKLMEEHIEERRWNTNTDAPTMAEQWLLRMIPESYSFGCHLDLTAELKTQLSRDPNFFKNPLVIKKYLLEFALPQIKAPQTQQTSTAAELQAGFTRSILLTATPSLPEIYPAFLKPENCFLEKAFEAQVIDTLLEEKNLQAYKLDEITTPTDFFDQFPAELLAEMTTLIDRGALLTDFDAKDIVNAYLDLLKPRVTQTGAFFAKGQMHLVTREPSDKVKERFDIAGSALVEALEEQGLSKKFILLLFLDLSKTTGIDIKRPHTDRAGLTVGKGQTVTETIQAAMRERQLLEDDAQTVAWLMFKSLYTAIDPEARADAFDPNKLFTWMIQNEAKEIETKLINRAYQGIDQALQEIVWQSLAEKYSIFRAKNLIEYQDISPWKIYEVDSKKLDTKVVLNNYVEKVLSTLNKTRREKIIVPKNVQERIDKIIAETSALIDKLYDPPKVALNNEVQQEMNTEMAVTQEKEQQTQQRMKTRLDQVSDFVFANERYSLKNDNLEIIFDKQQQQNEKRYQPLQLPACEGIKQPELLFCQSHFAVMQDAAESDGELDQLKPIEMLLVKITPDGKVQYLACTAPGANYYSRLLNDESLTEKGATYALIAKNGDIICTSNNTTPSQCKPFTETEDCQRMLTYVQFLNGKISNPIVLSRIIKEQGWTKDQYKTLANAIAKVHVSQHPVSLLDNPTLEILCGWETRKTQSDAMTATTHRRYQKPETSGVTAAVRTVQAVVEMDKPVDYSLPPIVTGKTERALEGYLFGEKPSPVAIRAEELELAHLMRDIQTLVNNNRITGKDESIAKLNILVLEILKSTRSAEDKIVAVKALYMEFKAFDEFLETLNNKLKNCAEVVNLAALKAIAQNVIISAYTSFAKGLAISDCKKELKDTLKSGVFAIGDKLQYDQGMKFVGTQSISTQFSKSELVVIVDQAVTELEKSQERVNHSV